jgi:hypothetical protein
MSTKPSRFCEPDSSNCVRWMFIFIPPAGSGVDHNPTNEEVLEAVKDFAGDDSLPAEILGVSKWYINEIVAEYYSDGNM